MEETLNRSTPVRDELSLQITPCAPEWLPLPFTTLHSDSMTDSSR